MIGDCRLNRRWAITAGRGRRRYNGPVGSTEVWLRGQTVPGVPALLQPVAHSLLQSREEIAAHVPRLDAADLWARPGGAASIGFHVRHAAGSLDRLATYARGEQLSAVQQAALAAEAEPDLSPDIAARLATAFDAVVERALAQLRATPEGTLLDAREVGRARLPSTVLGLLVHAAEHTQRHAGQIVTMVRVVTGTGADRSG
jgi:uncharacterized damage-inducible protein DinB